MPLVKSRDLGDVSEMGGRFARQKQQDALEVEKQKTLQAQQMLQMQTAAASLANKKSNGKRSLPSLEGSTVTVPGVKRPLIIPPHMNGAAELLKQKQEQDRQIKTAIADAEKTQKETVKKLTPQQLLLGQWQAMHGGEVGMGNEAR